MLHVVPCHHVQSQKNTKRIAKRVVKSLKINGSIAERRNQTQVMQRSSCRHVTLRILCVAPKMFDRKQALTACKTALISDNKNQYYTQA